MPDPIDAIMAFHNAFRRDMRALDGAAVAAARGEADAAVTQERFTLFNDVLAWHATGEEVAIFPALSAVAPLVSDAYVQDHRGLDAGCDAWREATSAGDSLEAARATAALKFHLDLHLAKEDTLLYPLVRERVSSTVLAGAMGKMSGAIPRERFPDVIAWLFPLLGADDAERLIRVWQAFMPEEAFAAVVPLVQEAVRDDWAEFTRRIPGLAE